MFAVEVENLTKTYGDLVVLRDMQLRVASGRVYGLLGPNGSGKSTLLHVLLGFLKPAQGKVRILGSTNLERARRRIGYVPERLRYHLHYSGREYLRFLGQFSDVPARLLRERVDRELARVGLSAAADRRLATYSKGMLQRIGVAQALLADPELLLIDEPTSGLDPAGQREVLDLLAEVRAHGHTILLCTHYLDEIEYLCDDVGVLTGGRLAAEAEVANLRTAVTSVIIRVDRVDAVARQQLEAITAGLRIGEQSVTIIANSEEIQAAVLRVLLDNDAMILGLEPLERPLEQFYLQVARGELPVTTVGAPADDGVPPPQTPVPVAAVEPEPPQRSRSEGDTLLNELLRRREGD